LELPLALYFSLLGFLGAVLHVLVEARKLEDLRSFAAARHMAIGAIVGFIYYILYTDYSFPDTLMALVAGYAGADFIEVLIERYARRGKE